MWGQINNWEKQVSLSDSKNKKRNLAFLFTLDKLFSVVFIIATQNIALSMACVLANGFSILSSYFFERGVNFFNAKNTLALSLILLGMYLFITGETQKFN